MKWGNDILPSSTSPRCGCWAPWASRSTREAYIWYREHIGGSTAPIVDTWRQTETGQTAISPLPGVTHGKPARDDPAARHQCRRRRRRGALGSQRGRRLSRAH
ncbi:MAG: hypothetical protein R2734_04340 [Nocardioides sp.]